MPVATAGVDGVAPLRRWRPHRSGTAFWAQRGLAAHRLLGVFICRSRLAPQRSPIEGATVAGPDYPTPLDAGRRAPGQSPGKMQRDGTEPDWPARARHEQRTWDLRRRGRTPYKCRGATDALSLSAGEETMDAARTCSSASGQRLRLLKPMIRPARLGHLAGVVARSRV